MPWATALPWNTGLFMTKSFEVGPTSKLTMQKIPLKVKGYPQENLKGF